MMIYCYFIYSLSLLKFVENPTLKLFVWVLGVAGQLLPVVLFNY